MKYIDKGVVYIQIDHSTTKEEMDTLKEQYKNKTIVFLKNGTHNIKSTISSLLKASL